MVERLFAEITQRCARRGSFTAVRELEKAMLAYLDNRNRDPKPFVWTADADLILGKVGRLCERISDSGHYLPLCWQIVRTRGLVVEGLRVGLSTRLWLDGIAIARAVSFRLLQSGKEKEKALAGLLFRISFYIGLFTLQSLARIASRAFDLASSFEYPSPE